MLRVQTWFLLLGLLVFPAFLAAEEPLPSAPSALVRSGWVRTEVVLGRLCLLNTRVGHGRIASAKDGSDVQENLAIQADGQQIHLTYDAETPDERISLLVVNERDITFRRQRTRETRVVEVHFRQPAAGKISLRVLEDGKRTDFTAENLWQLMLTEDKTCQLGLEEMLLVVKPQFSLPETIATIETQMLFLPTSDHRQHWDQLIAELADDQFEVRMAADRALREAGKLALGYLLKVNQTQFDSEQRQRIKRIVNDTALDTSDAPEIAAALIRDDLRAWLRLLESNDVAKRERAMAEVHMLSGKRISFNPQGPETARHEAVAALRKSLGLR